MRALAAGVLAGALLGGYQLVVVEPVIDDAIALEERLATEPDDHGHSSDEAMFSRSQQVGGGVAGSVVYAVVLSAVVGTVFAATRHRLPGRSDLGRSVWLAAVGFATVALVPALEYPPNPPAVGDPGTVGERTVQWLALVVAGIVLVRLLTAWSGVLRRRLPDHTRVVVVAACTVAVFGATLLLFPGTPDAVDAAVPAGLVWDFRIRAIGGLALLWTSLGLGLDWILERDAEPAGPRAAAAVAGP